MGGNRLSRIIGCSLRAVNRSTLNGTRRGVMAEDSQLNGARRGVMAEDSRLNGTRRDVLDAEVSCSRVIAGIT